MSHGSPTASPNARLSPWQAGAKEWHFLVKTHGSRSGRLEPAAGMLLTFWLFLPDSAISTKAKCEENQRKKPRWPLEAAWPGRSRRAAGPWGAGGDGGLWGQVLWCAAPPGGIDRAERRAGRGTCACQAGEDERGGGQALRCTESLEKTKDKVICRLFA